MRKIYISFIVASIFSTNTFTQTTYTVSTTADAGAGSLRQAIIDANASASANDIINFTVGTSTITLASNLPALTGAGVTINGNTATGYVANTNATWPGSLNGTLAITIDGNTNAAITYGIRISSDNNIINGLNFINVGTVAGAVDYCIEIIAGADNNQILGCYIGTDVNGTASAGANTNNGIRIENGANNQIGDGTAAGRNLISGLKTGSSNDRGIAIVGASATGNIVKGNIIGLQKDGATFLAVTQMTGIAIVFPTGNIIGGTGVGDGNVISGNGSWGIDISQASGTSVLGNIIGPQADGITNVAGNSQTVGVRISSSANCTIGNSTVAGRNIISGNLNYGILLNQATTTGNMIKGNYIGPGSTLANIGGSSQDWGVFINVSASSNIIGGTVAGEGNIIAFNTLLGVWNSIGTCDFNKISGNPIYSNTGIPIDNAAGANNSKAVPIITTANTTTVVGTSTAVGDIVEVFSNTTGNCNDAVTFEGFAITDASLNWSLGVTLANGDYVLATATDGSNNTSEFSPCVVALPVELLSFTAVCLPVLQTGQNNTVELKWSTASEINNDYFTIERTLNGFNYQLIGTVKGVGNSSTTQYYSLSDNEPLPGLAYYRLKQTDFNGQYEYFPLVAISCGKGIDIISIYPNPAIGEVNILVSSSELTGVTINLIDVLSRKVISNTAFAKQGDNTFTLDVSTLSSGSYMLQAITESGLYRVQKQFVVR